MAQDYGNPADLGQFTVSPKAALEQAQGPELGAYGEVGGELTGMPGGSQLGADWTPDTPEEMQRKMEEREIYDAQFKIEALIDESRDYKQRLIDKQFAGLDPSLRNTEKLGKELATMEVKTVKSQLMEALGRDDDSEMTPKERLMMLTATDQARREAMMTVRQQKQDDIASLGQAVSQYNAGLQAQMADIQKRTTELQTKHAVEAKVEGKLEQERIKAKAPGKPEKLSDFKWAYNIWKKDNPKGSPTEFRREWEKPSGISGGLTEASIVKSIDDLALTSGTDPAKAYSNYLKYRKTLGREGAFSKVRQEMMKVTLPANITKTSEALKWLMEENNMSEQEAKAWLRANK